MSIVIGGTTGAILGTGILTSAVGAGTAIYGANQNKKAIDNANKTNQQIAADTNAANYQLWLESRGQMSDGTAVNTKLPRWMTVRVNGTPTVKRALVKKGQSPTLANPYAGVSASPYAAPTPSAPASGLGATGTVPGKTVSQASGMNRNASIYEVPGDVSTKVLNPSRLF